VFLSAKHQTMQKVMIFSAGKCKEIQALSDGFVGPPTAVFCCCCCFFQVGFFWNKIQDQGVLQVSN